MKKHISFPDIKDFKTALNNITHMTRFRGLDESGKCIYDDTPLPTITFKGTVKLHGTNAGVCFNEESGIWFQSREDIITVQNDNAGFAFFASTHSDAFMKIIRQVSEDNAIDLNVYTVSVYGEWAGKEIQKGVAICELDKAFYLFGVKISKPQDEDFRAYWVDSTKYIDIDNRIYNVDQFPTYTLNIDFDKPNIAAEKLTEITMAVEAECPTGKALGVSGIGEGVVWRGEYKGTTIRFKVKGPKHSVVKVKKVVEVDPVKLANITEFVDRTVTENRVEQAIQMTCSEPLDKSMLGPFLKWLVNDIIKEESHVLSENGLEPKDVTNYLSTRGREMFIRIYEGF